MANGKNPRRHKDEINREEEGKRGDGKKEGREGKVLPVPLCFGE